MAGVSSVLCGRNPLYRRDEFHRKTPRGAQSRKGLPIHPVEKAGDDGPRAEPITVYGDGRQTRCFCDVRDALEALIGLAASDQASGQVFNVGSCEEVAILDLARRIQTLTGSRSGIRHIPYAEAYGPGFEDMQRRVPDLARIEKLLGWKPTRRLDEILGAVIEHERRSLARPADAALPEASCP